MSPELLPDGVPPRPMPIAARRARRSSCVGISGASVARMTMIEPFSRLQSVSSVMLFPTGTPQTVSQGRSPWFACTRAATVKVPERVVARREAVPVPPLNS